MGRPKNPDGRRNHENVMLSDAERDLIDSVRGDVKRGPWIRQAAVEAARRAADSRIQESLGIKVITDDRQPPGTVSVIAPGEGKAEVRSFALEPAAEPSRKRKLPCEHRVQPGSYCTRCKRLI